MKKADVTTLTVSRKRVFLRVDFNVPITPEGKVADDRRIRAAVPTMKSILDRGGSIVAASHLGRPKGKRSPEFSLEPCAKTLEAILGVPVGMAPDCTGDETASLAAGLAPGQVLLLENLRFHEGEQANDAGFASSLASLADLYVNDAFGSAHRAHASVEAICKHFERPSAGLLMEKEISHLSKLLSRPDRPYVAILGGAKVSDKIELIENLLPRVSSLIIGGAMAYTFLKAAGKETGSSLVEGDKLDLARALVGKARDAGVKLLLPADHVVAEEGGTTPLGVTEDENVPRGRTGFDIGPRSAAAFGEEISGARTILWNGPLGRFELKGFATGTRRIATSIAEATKGGSLSVVGGGDSAAAIKAFGMEAGFSHVSTGGGASLEFLSGRELPGVAALADAV